MLFSELRTLLQSIENKDACRGALSAKSADLRCDRRRARRASGHNESCAEGNSN